MASTAPTLSNQRWGPEGWQLFNYWAHPIRDGGGNPLLIWRHGGGGVIGNYTTVTMDTSYAAEGYIAYLLWYLNQSARDMHFDIVSIQTSQQVYTVPISTIRRTKRQHMLENIQDHKRGIAAIKAWGQGHYGQTTYKINPYKVITGGHSFGGTLTALSMITPPTVYPTSNSIGSIRRYEPNQFDSTSLGVIFFSSQVDFRNRSLPSVGGPDTVKDYLDYTAVGGIFGTRVDDTHAEWDLIPAQMKESVSLLAYIQKGHTQFYKPMYVLYQNYAGFAGTYPLTENHDIRMQEDLCQALQAKGLPFAKDVVQDQTSPPGPMTEDKAPAIYDWMCRLVRQGSGPRTVYG